MATQPNNQAEDLWKKLLSQHPYPMTSFERRKPSFSRIVHFKHWFSSFQPLVIETRTIYLLKFTITDIFHGAFDAPSVHHIENLSMVAFFYAHVLRFFENILDVAPKHLEWRRTTRVIHV